MRSTERRYGFGWVFFFALASLLGQWAQAGLILQSNQMGTKQSIGTDSAIRISLNGFTGKFFGESVSHLWLAENGYLSPAPSLAAGEDYFSESLLVNTMPRIANFWDDIRVFSEADGAPASSGIFFVHEPGKYLSVTWADIFLFNDAAAGSNLSSTSARSFQTVWFESDMSIEQFEFKRNDIVFGFSGFRQGFIDATVGMRDLHQFISIDEATGRPPGQAGGGMISTTRSTPGFPNAHLLPWDQGQFLLFRANESSDGSFMNYSASIGSLGSNSIAAVPEPSCMVMVATGFGLFLFSRGTKGWRRTPNRSRV